METSPAPLEIQHADPRLGEMDPTRVYQLLITELNTLLQEVVGVKETQGLITIVAERVGEVFAMQANAGASERQCSVSDISEHLLSLQETLGAKFKIQEIRPTFVVLENSRCPFGDKVKDNHALCNFTVGVIGTVTASLNSYAGVSLDKTIAKGNDCCTVKVYFDASEEKSAVANEFFR